MAVDTAACDAGHSRGGRHAVLTANAVTAGAAAARVRGSGGNGGWAAIGGGPATLARHHSAGAGSCSLAADVAAPGAGP